VKTPPAEKVHVVTCSSLRYNFNFPGAIIRIFAERAGTRGVPVFQEFCFEGLFLPDVETEQKTSNCQPSNQPKEDPFGFFLVE
jgi:hypothetical protein